MKLIQILFTNGGGTNHFYTMEIKGPQFSPFRIAERENKTVKANSVTVAPLNLTRSKFDCEIFFFGFSWR
jgi:hypothetical protein